MKTITSIFVSVCIVVLVRAQIPSFKCFCEENKLVYFCKCWSTILFVSLQNDSFPDVFHAHGKSDQDVDWVDYSLQPITELPNFTQKFKKMRILTATNSSLKNIKLYGHSRLEEIDMKHNKISSTDVLTFMMNNKLKFLDLSHNSFTALKYSTFQGLVNLEFLSLAWNKISTIEDLTFNHIPKLYQLNLEGNLIKKLPKWMFFLNSNLGDINLNKNQITEIDTDFVVATTMNREMIVRVQNNVCVNKTVGLTTEAGHSYAVLSDLSKECRDNLEKMQN